METNTLFRLLPACAFLRTVAETGDVSGAAAKIGIPTRIINEWLEPSDDPDVILFQLRFEQARSIYEAQLLRSIEKAAEKDWKAAVWLLERKNPSRWARSSVLPSNGGKGTANHANTTPVGVVTTNSPVTPVTSPAFWDN